MKHTAPLRLSTTLGAAPTHRVAQARGESGERLAVRRVVLLVGVTATLMALPASDATAHSQDKDCADFSTQRAAQDHQDTHTGDPDRLNDANGVTCPQLPCPCGATPLPPAEPIPVRPPSAAPLAPLTTTARVSRVVDGDALTVRRSDGEMITVRLIGIGSPTTRAAGSRGECGAQDAIARMKRLAFRDGVGRIVELRTDPMRDREGELDALLAYVGVGGVDFGRTMIASGWAKVQPSQVNFLRISAYRKAQASAKAAKRGLWRRCDDSALPQ